MSHEKRSSIGRAIRNRRLALRIAIPILVTLMAAGAVGLFSYQAVQETKAEEAKFSAVQSDYIDTWCSTFGQIEFDASVPHQEWKAKLRNEFDFDSSIEEWKRFAARNDEYLRRYPQLFFSEPSGKQELIISLFYGDDFVSWDNYEWTQEMVENDLEYTFWPLHEVFGNEVNEYGKLRPSC